MLIKPARPDLIVRDPIHMRPLRAGGEERPANAYWLRLLRDGDVVEVEPPAKPDTKPSPGK